MHERSKANHDLPTLLRFVAITLIVSSHFDFFEYGGGGALFLLVMIGYNIATFKLNRVLKGDSIATIGVMIIKVAIPTLLYTLLLNLVFGPFHWQSVFLVSNLFPENHPNGFGYWFIEVYIQLQFAVMLAFSFPAVRACFVNNAKLASWCFVLLCCVLYLICEALFDAAVYARRLPWLLVWLVAFGFAARFADKPLEKLGLLLGIALMIGLHFKEMNLYLLGSCALLFFNPPIRLPKYVRPLINYVAAGSLFIYLTHFQWRSLGELFVSDQPMLFTVIALLGGATIFHVYNRTFNKRLVAILEPRRSPAPLAN